MSTIGKFVGSAVAVAMFAVVTMGCAADPSSDSDTASETAPGSVFAPGEGPESGVQTKYFVSNASCATGIGYFAWGGPYYVFGPPPTSQECTTWCTAGCGYRGGNIDLSSQKWEGTCTCYR